jgi:hypothetical protein
MSWELLVTALGEPEASPLVASIATALGEPPEISETPPEYNDPLGKTRFHKFIQSGVEIGFRQNRLNHLHLYVQEHEGYKSYTGPLEKPVLVSWGEDLVRREFGEPSKSGGGMQNPLLGYRNIWLRYDKGRHAIRYEFSKGNSLKKISLILV